MIVKALEGEIRGAGFGSCEGARREGECDGREGEEGEGKHLHHCVVFSRLELLASPSAWLADI